MSMPLRSTTPEKLIEQLSSSGQVNLNESDFRKLAAFTALRRSGSGDYYISNFWRGPVLHRLVQALRPNLILEIGTGRGYGTLSMLRAIKSANLPTKIISIDRISPRTAQEWVIDDGSGPKVSALSLSEVWNHLVPDWEKHVELRTGSSIHCMRSMLKDSRLQSVDFAFVDGGHEYWTVRHDILAAVMAGKGRSVSLLLDDYDGVQGQDVMKIVDMVLCPKFGTENACLIKMPLSETELADNGPHNMVFFDGRCQLVTASRLTDQVPPSAALFSFACLAELSDSLRSLRRVLGHLARRSGMLDEPRPASM